MLFIIIIIIIFSYSAIQPQVCLINSVSLLCTAGRQYDKFGNLVDWWGNKSAQQFSDLAQCFVDEYNQFTVFGHHVRASLCVCNVYCLYVCNVVCMKKSLTNWRWCRYLFDCSVWL